MDTVERATADGTITDAEAARDELRDALAGVGITLPSLGLDGPSLASDAPRPLVELGRCAPEVARRLATALRRTPRDR
ncbi:hypothetical protein ACH4OW_06430 [Streptomyces sp. NPDC017056]|uniref:hypothetical protein n=1 Tax=Streptomyces sp. NPDC017056 TaxID=3364973 RepID=UPI0037BD0DD0